MDILFLCPAFQPYCPVAATRPPALARYLIDQGHTLRVLAAHNTRYDAITQPPIDASLITYVDMWLAQDVLATMVRPFKRKKLAQSPNELQNTAVSQSTEPSPISPFKAWFYDAFDYTFNYPDSYMGWIKKAERAGADLIEERKPDILFSTAPPHSTNVVANALSARYDLPWVCEYRDLWMDHPYHTPNRVRRFFETRLEKRSIAAVDHFVAVSVEAQQVLEATTDKPCVLAYNGYNPADFGDMQQVAAPLSPSKLTLVYAGSIYPKTRDPSLLFEALVLLGDKRCGVDVRFYTEGPGTVRALAQKYDVEDCVSFHATRPYAEILQVERQADVLFLMRWDDPREDGVIPGKIFEYLGARRPILSTGRTEGEVGDILKGRPQTLLSRSAADIAAQLEKWLAERVDGRLADVEHEGDQRFTRQSQFQGIETLLGSLV